MHIYEISSNSYTKEELADLCEKKTKIKGIVSRVDKNKNSLYTICRKNGTTKAIVFPMTELSWSQRRNVRVGMDVTFTVKQTEEGSFIPEGCVFTENNRVIRSKPVLVMPTGEKLLPKYILKYGFGNSLDLIMRRSGITYEEIKKNGYRRSDFDHVYIHTNMHDYKVYQKGGPLTGDAQVDSLEELYRKLNKVILDYDEERDLRLREAQKEKENTGQIPDYPGAVIGKRHLFRNGTGSG